MTEPSDELGRRRGLIQRRRQKIADEIARNRRGEYTVPTWVMVLILLVVLAAWATLIAIS